jgi:hypothetical protein
VAEVWYIIPVNKQKLHILHMGRFNFSKLNKVEGKKQNHLEVSDSFVALEDLDAEVDINSASETVRI